MTGGPASPGAPRVLVVDDSAVVRQALAQILGAAGFGVTTAPDPLVARQRIARERPAAIVLDLEMPRMDGLTFLRALMAEEPIPVVICSGHAGEGSALAAEALAEGAVDVVARPRLGVKGFLEDSAGRLVEVVRAASVARVQRREPLRVRPAPPPLRVRGPGTSRTGLVVLGASTGGTEALLAVLQALPEDAPPVAVVQHMPPYFTAQFARRLDGLCRLEVKEAEAGDALVPGRALVAPGDRHLVVARSSGGGLVRLEDGPAVARHRPSVDVLFRSAARAYGADAIGALLTGMGDDGADGLAALRVAGAHTIAQDEASCVVFGMPREAILRGAAGEVLPLAAIGEAIVRWAGSRAAEGPNPGPPGELP